MLVFLLLFAAGTLSGCEKETASVSKTGFFLDTVVSITLYDTENTSPLEECFSRLASYEKLFSRTQEGSDVWRINHSDGNPVEVSAETADLLEKALSYCRLSDGAFDITIAPVLTLWNFDADQKTGTVPDESDLIDALSHVGYKNIQLDGTTVTLLDPDTSIDLGGIAKGYIAALLKEDLVSAGYTSGIIDLGGNILTIGSKPHGQDFRIGVRTPKPDATQPLTTISCRNASVVTSGTYERYFIENGKRYHHILSPFDGHPVENGLASVTIFSEHSVDGDALSTACFVLGPEKGMALIESLDGIEALFVTDDLEMKPSSGWPDATT
ncbi:MAG: FAD:protein FMN transferase [Lachnospiraceae bacterium]